VTIALSYDDTLSRVQISLSDLSDGIVRVERSVNGLLWETVRGGVELPIASGSGQLYDAEFPADVEITYRVVDPDTDTVLESDTITPSLDGQVWLKSPRYPLLNTLVKVADYQDVSHDPRSVAFPIAGRALPVGATELHLGRAYVLTLGTDTDAEQERLSLIARLGEVMFLHVPTVASPQCEGNLLLPGSMYALIGRLVKHRVAGVSAYHRFDLPLVEVTAPGPDVTPTTLTWGTIERLYGSWTNLLSAHSTWADLLDLVGDPDDLVVL